MIIRLPYGNLKSVRLRRPYRRPSLAKRKILLKMTGNRQRSEVHIQLETDADIGAGFHDDGS